MNRSITEHPLVGEYLDALRREAATLPRPRRTELVAEIRSHLELSSSEQAGEAEVRDLLDRLGTPREIVAEEPAAADRAPGGPQPLRRRDVVGLLLLLAGGFAVPPLGYLIGTALLGTSRRWSVPVRAVLVGLPAALALTWVVDRQLGHRWYAVQDLVRDPSGLAGDLFTITSLTLPFVAAQVALLVAIRHLPLTRRS